MLHESFIITILMVLLTALHNDRFDTIDTRCHNRSFPNQDFTVDMTHADPLPTSMNYVVLYSCLDGPAGQVLWDYGPQTSFSDIVELLRARFGQQGQAERYRAEIKARRRKPGETLQHLHQDVCRMVALAYPQEPGSRLSTIVARDAFLDALNDRKLYVHVHEQEPQTIEHALALACKLESTQVDGG